MIILEIEKNKPKESDLSRSHSKWGAAVQLESVASGFQGSPLSSISIISLETKKCGTCLVRNRDPLNIRSLKEVAGWVLFYYMVGLSLFPVATVTSLISKSSAFPSVGHEVIAAHHKSIIDVSSQLR